jgi:excisionase family DNA binding protein
MTDLARALVDALDDDALEALAVRLGPRLAELLGSQREDRWLCTREAAEYLGLGLGSLHKLTARRDVPFAQDSRGGKCWFLKSELDAWRRAGCG